MITRRTALLALAAPALAGCGARRQTAAYRPQPYAPQPAHPAIAGLDAVIDISHNVTVSDFAAVRRRSNILGIIHKATEGGDWIDPSYGVRRPQAEQAGLLWGAYHFGTRQFTGARQAAFFLAVVRPGPGQPRDGLRWVRRPCCPDGSEPLLVRQPTAACLWRAP